MRLLWIGFEIITRCRMNEPNQRPLLGGFLKENPFELNERGVLVMLPCLVSRRTNNSYDDFELNQRDKYFFLCLLFREKSCRMERQQGMDELDRIADCCVPYSIFL